MKRRYLEAIRIFTYIICFCLMCSYAQAELKDEMVKYLVERGIQNYQDKQYREAVYDFKKALLIDPQNRPALSYLDRMGVRDQVDEQEIAYRIEMNNLREHLIEFKTMVASLQEERYEIQQKFDDVLSEKKEITKADQIKQRQIDCLYAKLDEMYDKLSDRIEWHKQDCERLKELECLLTQKEKAQKDLIRKESIDEEEEAVGSIKQRKEIYALKLKLGEILEQSKEDEKELAYLSQSYHDLRQKLLENTTNQDKIVDVMDDYLALKEERIQKMKDEWIKREMELLRARKQIIDGIDLLVD